jgi:hypothetical protein
VQDGYESRKKFLIHILKYLANEVEDNIPGVVPGDLTRINGPWILKIRDNLLVLAFYTHYIDLCEVNLKRF